MTHKTPLAQFLAMNPFTCPRTLGFFYREKMRAIHHVAPDVRINRILEVGGGRSGLASMLYPEAEVFNVDIDSNNADADCNRKERVRFVVADATCLPFADESFDLITMFDLLEHVPDDASAVREAVRTLRSDGTLLVSTPRETWRYPYFRMLRGICPTEETLFQEWGHVRRGYSISDLEQLIPLQAQAWSSFVSPTTALNHDISFSNLPKAIRVAICGMISPLTWAGYHLNQSKMNGSETASAWTKCAGGIA